MSVISDAILAKAKVTYAKLNNPKSKKEVDINAEVDKLKSFADSLKDKQLKLLDGEYSAKMKLLPASLPARIAKYRLERFNTTDKEQFNTVKMTLGDITAMLNEDADLRLETSIEDEQQKLEDKAIQESEKRIAEQKNKEDITKKENDLRNKEAEAKLRKEHADDFMLQARSVAKMAEHDIENYKATKEAAYKDEESKIDQEAKTKGYSKGTADVEKYNKALEKTAKKNIDKLKKAIAKGKISIETAKQKVILKLSAKIGL